jgi:hypothetical protein
MLVAEHSKAQNTRIVKWVNNNQQRFDDLFRILLNDEPVIQQRAAWAMSCAVIKHPALIKKHFKKLLDNLEKPNLHNAVKRNSIQVFEEIEIPEKFHGRIMDRCFSYISDPAEAVAVKAFSLGVLRKFAKQYPEIKQELKAIIEERWEFETPAFHSRAKKILLSDRK